MSAFVAAKITYEQPLNERIRTFLRLEFLCMQAAHYMEGGSVWDSRAALNALMDIHSIFGRSDLKSEILKEMDRHTANLARLEQNPNVDRARLGKILDELDVRIDQLHSLSGQVGQALRDNEFINSIKQRSTIPGGTCDFDLPAYHYWLQRPSATRKSDLERWLGEFSTVSTAIGLILRLIRESAPSARAIAEEGFFQKSLDSSVPFQLIRVTLPHEAPYFAEISAGKHRFTVRIMQYLAAEQRPVQVDQDIEFELACCVI